MISKWNPFFSQWLKVFLEHLGVLPAVTQKFRWKELSFCYRLAEIQVVDWSERKIRKNKKNNLIRSNKIFKYFIRAFTVILLYIGQLFIIHYPFLATYKMNRHVSMKDRSIYREIYNQKTGELIKTSVGDSDNSKLLIKQRNVNQSLSLIEAPLF